MPMMQAVKLGPLEAIIDEELERSCAERSERELAAEAITDSSAADTSAGGAATEGTQAEEGAQLAGKIDEMASRVR